MHRTGITLVITVVLALTAALAAQADHASSAASPWTRVSGPAGAGVELGLARTGDGVLNVMWNRGNPAPTTIFDTRFSPAGASLGTHTVATNFGGANGLALLVMPDNTLRLFAAGSPTTGATTGGINTFTAQANGAGWALDQGAIWGGAGAAATPVIGAALTKDGQPVTSWAGYVKQGLDTSYSSTAFEPFMGSSSLAADGASGAIALSGEEIDKQGGTFVQQVLPSKGPAVVLPSATRDGGVSGLAGRLGAPGFYVAYENTTRTGVTKPAVKLYRYGGATRTIAAGPFTTAKVFTGPAGRLWLVWGDSTDGVFVTRTNKAAGTLEPVQKLKLPAGTSYVWNAQGEGSAGPLDLFADLGVGSSRGFWHTHVLAEFSLQARATLRAKGTAAARISLSVRDAGDPVPDASVSVGGKRVKTDARGNATLALKPGSYSATALAAGYAPASAKFTVR